jgi:hypothetical protein
MGTFAFYVHKGCLIKVINGEEFPCSESNSKEIANAILSSSPNILIHELSNTIQRGLVLEQKTNGYSRAVPFVDLLKEKWKGIRGTYKITVEFTPDKGN